MIAIDLVYNLALLVALSVLSGFIGSRCRQRLGEQAMQGLLFGSVAVIGMLRPLVLEPGVFFDGRSVMLSLCGLFFGPLAVGIAGAMAMACRVWQGGPGQFMGLLVIWASGTLGLVFHYRSARKNTDISAGSLLGLGFLVHAVMVLLMLALPYEMAINVLKRVALPVLTVYPLAMVLIGKVLSDRRARGRFLEELQESREELRTTLYSIGDGIVTTDGEGRVRQLNPVAEKLLGWTEAEACGRRYDEVFRIVDETTRAVVENPVERVLREGRIVGLTNHTLLLTRDGKECPIADSGAPIRNKEGGLTGVVLVFRDQSAERAAQRKMTAQHDHLKATQESLKRIEWMLSKKPPKPSQEKGVADGYGDLTGLNHEGRIRKAVSHEMLASIVSEYLDLLGTSSAIYEANGDYAFGLFDSCWCRMLDQATRRLCGTGDNAAALASGLWRCHESCWTGCSKEAIARRAPVDVECHGGLRLYSVPIFLRDEVIGAINFGYGDPPRDPDKLRALADAYQLDYETLLREAQAYDSRPPYIIDMAKSRLHVSAWLIGSLVEAKQSEEERVRLEDQFRQSQKLEAIGRLAGGVAHDFNNILQAIIGYSELLLEKLPQSGETHEFAREIIEEGNRATNLTRQLLAFARKQSIDPKVLDLNEAVALTLKMLRRLLSEEIELSWKPAAARCLVKIDTSQLDQILTNLAVNARDAIAGVGKMILETGKVVLDGAYCALNPGFTPGPYVVLTARDDGCGMDRATLDRLFEPFFTTKERGRGTGLGLATIYGIVKQNHGVIHVQSMPNEGTTFTVFLPEHASVDVPAVVPPVPEPQPSGTETVLIVDDEESLLRSARRILEGLGYTVLVAGGPVEAIRLVQDYPHEIHLLLTDVVMPGMSGRDLWSKLEVLRPTMKCVFMSGYTANIIAQRSVLDKGVRFLQKPFSKTALANKLREVLAKRVG